MKNNRTDFESLNEDNAEKARLTRSQVNIKAHPDEKHHTHGRFESEQQAEAYEDARTDADRIVDLDDEE